MDADGPLVNQPLPANANAGTGSAPQVEVGGEDAVEVALVQGPVVEVTEGGGLFRHYERLPA